MSEEEKEGEERKVNKKNEYTFEEWINWNKISMKCQKCGCDDGKYIQNGRWPEISGILNRNELFKKRKKNCVRTIKSEKKSDGARKSDTDN